MGNTKYKTKYWKHKTIKELQTMARLEIKNDDRRRDLYDEIGRRNDERVKRKRFGEVTVQLEVEYTATGSKLTGEVGVSLPHRCGSWDIGNIEDTDEFLAHLTDALEYAREIDPNGD